VARDPHIGTLGENSLHAALKAAIAQPGDRFEVPVDGYVIDIVRGDQLIEIQTANFAAMKRKLAKLTRKHRVHLVHPIAAEKWIVKYGPDGETWLDRRRSPRHGTVFDVFRELVSFPHLLRDGSLTLEVLLTHEEEIRVNDGRGSWRRQGWSIADRVLVDILEHQPDGQNGLLPARDGRHRARGQPGPLLPLHLWKWVCLIRSGLCRQRPMTRARKSARTFFTGSTTVENR
jgi:hypothetical protein